MSILSIAIIIFVLLESLNVLTLYFDPGSQLGNGIGVFDAWERSRRIQKCTSSSGTWCFGLLAQN